MTFSALDSELVGPLLATEAMRRCFSDAARLRTMLLVEAALARVQGRKGIVPPGLSEALDAIDPDSLDRAAIGQATMLSAVPTIPFVKMIQARLDPDLEREFHKGATTQDILDTALVLQCRDAIALLARDLATVLDGLSRLAEEHRLTPCVGRTYGQHAAPITFGFKAAVWLAGIAEVAAQLPAVRSAMLVASLGGPVGTLAAMGPRGPEVLDAVAQDLGLGTVSIAWHARRGRIAQMGSWLCQAIGAAAKFAGDVAHLASTEVAEVAEPYSLGRGGSSAMPHKRNPVSCTVILAAHAAAPGHGATLLGAMAAGHERPAGLWHSEWHALPSLFGLASGALREAAALATGLEVNEERMRTNIDATRGMLFADAAAARLGATMGRGAAHKLVEEAATQARRTGQHLSIVLREVPSVQGLNLDVAPAFGLTPAIAAAGPWIDRARAEAAAVSDSLRATLGSPSPRT